MKRLPALWHLQHDLGPVRAMCELHHCHPCLLCDWQVEADQGACCRGQSSRLQGPGHHGGLSAARPSRSRRAQQVRSSLLCCFVQHSQGEDRRAVIPLKGAMHADGAWFANASVMPWQALVMWGFSYAGSKFPRACPSPIWTAWGRPTMPPESLSSVRTCSSSTTPRLMPP